MEYLQSLYLVSKPFISYIGLKSVFLIGSYSGEWYSARIYSINCIGEGINGYFDHFWTMASPTCTSLLATHVSLLGVFITSCGLTIVTWFLYLFNNHIKSDYNKVQNMLDIEKKKDD